MELNRPAGFGPGLHYGLDFRDGSRPAGLGFDFRTAGGTIETARQGGVKTVGNGTCSGRRHFGKPPIRKIKPSLVSILVESGGGDCGLERENAIQATGSRINIAIMMVIKKDSFGFTWRSIK